MQIDSPFGLAKPKTSWAGIVKKNQTSNFKLHYIKPQPNSKRDVIKIPRDVSIVGSQPWESSLVGFFLKKLPYSFVKNTTARMWSKHGLIDMLATDSGYYVFKFSCQEECEAILEGGPWHLAGQPIILKKWQAGIRFEKEPQSTIPIWVHIYNIPLELWNQEGLSHIASAIGRPLLVDKMTSLCRRISYARLCIEVDAESELLKTLDIEIEEPIYGEPEVITLKIEYQWKPERCAKCRRFGHDCLKVQRAINPQQPLAQSKADQDEGIWMVKVRVSDTNHANL